jgi:cytoplasmic iron level regulating protein YaaA (DUF328/UPF0246 family)
MISLLYPPKGQGFTSPVATTEYALPELAEQSQLFINELRKFSSDRLQELMAINPKIAELITEQRKVLSLPPVQAEPWCMVF